MNHLKKLSAVILILSFFSSCSVEKRRYTKGYNVQWANKLKKKTVKINEVCIKETNHLQSKIENEEIDSNTIHTNTKTSKKAENKVQSRPELSKKSNKHSIENNTTEVFFKLPPLQELKTMRELIKQQNTEPNESFDTFTLILGMILLILLLILLFFWLINSGSGTGW